MKSSMQPGMFEELLVIVNNKAATTWHHGCFVIDDSFSVFYT
ncbi:hypothetical protein [Fodinisporobacter ferrooxydans]